MMRAILLVANLLLDIMIAVWLADCIRGFLADLRGLAVLGLIAGVIALALTVKDIVKSPVWAAVRR